MRVRPLTSRAKLAAARVFAVPELRFSICRSIEDAHDLYNLALVSRDWEAVASQVLWEGPISLLPLLVRFPRDAWEFDDSIKHAKRHSPYNWHAMQAFRFTRPLTAADWEPVLSRARTVKEVTLAPFKRPVMNALYACPPPRTLFPNLRHVKIADIDPPLPPTFLDAILPSDLAEYETFDFGEVTLPGSTRWPYLRVLLLQNFLDSMAPAAVARTIAIVESAPGLERVQLSVGPHPNLVVALASLRNLRCIHLDKLTPKSVPSPMPAGAFPSLTSLWLGGPGCIAFMLSVLEASTSMRSVEDIALWSSPIEALEVRALIRAIATHCNPTVLRCLRLSVSGRGSLEDEEESSPDDTLHCSDLAPLSVFTNLRNVEIDTSQGPVLSDSDWKTIAGWWPRIQSLELYRPGRYRRDDDVPPCTLRALSDIARLCPELDRLVAAFDARIVPDDVDVQQTKLSWFDVVDSPIASPPAVARVVSALFPELLYLVYDDGYVPPDMDSDSGEDVPMPDPEADDTPEARRRAAWATVREMLEVKSEPHTSDYET
ncbi:hypothetical protein K523DRAFT_421135 [Schizophyllum commune Tattone D]|nr:hypothetical protein K523DRAFT_421135 [Schizophyllum commune Tattone D]